MAFARLATFPCAIAVLILIAVAVPTHPESAAASTFTVSKQADTADGTCDNDCSLREAIIAANASPGADVITLPPGIYPLSIPGAEEDGGLTGDLDIASDLTINGAGAASTAVDSGIAGDLTTNGEPTSTIVDAGGIDRVFDVVGSVHQTYYTVTITGVTIRGGNPQAYGGGGIRNDFSSLTVNDSAVIGNTAPWAGGIESRIGGAALVLNNSVVSDNTAAHAGGILNNSGTLAISNSTISNNTTNGHVGGIWNGGGPMTIMNSTVSGNEASGFGGGISTTFETSLDSVTIAGNAAGLGSGGGIEQTGNQTVTVKNTIIAGNSGQTANSDCAGTLTSQGHNLVQAVTAGCTIAGDTSGNLIGADPLLGPLQNNGGPTPTRALLAGSPAIDSGSDVGCPDTDQRGYSRPADGDNSRPVVCDIGAFEAGATPATPTPTASPTPTPTEPPPELMQGDVDCSGEITSVDALKELRYVAQLSVSQSEPCPDIGAEVTSVWGDVDCIGSVTSVDALKILRYVAQLPVTQTEPCPDIGGPES